MEGKEVGRLVVGQDLFGASEHTLPHARTNTHKHTHSVKVKTHTHTHTHTRTHTQRRTRTPPWKSRC